MSEGGTKWQRNIPVPPEVRPPPAPWCLCCPSVVVVLGGGTDALSRCRWPRTVGPSTTMRSLSSPLPRPSTSAHYDHERWWFAPLNKTNPCRVGAYNTDRSTRDETVLWPDASRWTRACEEPPTCVERRWALVDLSASLGVSADSTLQRSVLVLWPMLRGARPPDVQTSSGRDTIVISAIPPPAEASWPLRRLSQGGGAPP
jgi:hypothetical protein